MRLHKVTMEKVGSEIRVRRGLVLHGRLFLSAFVDCLRLRLCGHLDLRLVQTGCPENSTEKSGFQLRIIWQQQLSYRPCKLTEWG